MDRVVVEAPASCANLGPGFDVFALALEKPRDRIVLGVDRSAEPGIEVQTSGARGIKDDPHNNAAGAVAYSIVREFGLKARVKIGVRKGVPVGVGLGSSGASSAAAAYAMNRAFELKMKVEEIIAHAGEGERAASGSAHLDNVTASLLGGIVVVRGEKVPPLYFKAPETLSIVVVTPKVVLPERKTEYARSLVPSSVSARHLVANVAMASTMAAGMARGDIRLIGDGMQDAVVEPARSKMVPGFKAVKRAALQAGAAGVCLSGAGPSMLALVDGASKGRKVMKEMKGSFAGHGVEASAFVTRVGEGARVVAGP